MVSFRMTSWIQRSLGLRPRFKRIRRRKIAGLSRGAMSAQVVHLEQRVLPSANNIVDLNTDTNFQNDSSHPNQFTEVNTVNGPRTFFTYNTPVTNKPILGVTQGTST